MIVENIKQVEENIKQACEKVGRNPEEVTLICSKQSKTLHCNWRSFTFRYFGLWWK